MKKRSIYMLALAALFIALGLLLPLVTGQVPAINQRGLPMHFPILLCGLICGWKYGLAVGFITPLLRSAIFGMPVLYPTAIAMAVELAAYGCLAGLFYRMFRRKNLWAVYGSLVPALLLGRGVLGIANMILYGIGGKAYSMELFLTSAFLNGLPGIIAQLILIPAAVMLLNRFELIKNQN